MNKFDNERIKYEDSYVAFLDVLGFKNLVFSKLKDSKKKLNIYFNILDKVIKYLKKIDEKKEIGYIVISDSIILTITQGTDKSQKINNLRQLCIAISFLQSALSVEDIWIRGAISSGETYFDKINNQIVGPAYINAYLLEESLSKYPRVILDNKIIKELEFNSSQDFIDEFNEKKQGGLNFTNCGSNILFDWYSNIELEKDIPLFIDYLSFFLKETDELNKTEIRNKVIDNIESNIYSNTSLYEKFKWLAKYFSNIMQNHKCFSNEVSRLKNL